MQKRFISQKASFIFDEISKETQKKVKCIFIHWETVNEIKTSFKVKHKDKILQDKFNMM